MVSLTCFFIASMLWAVMNTWMFHYSTSVFTSLPDNSFFGVDSWMRKYTRARDLRFFAPGKSIYYRLFKIDYRERFAGSATIFAFLTDGYHLCQFIMLWLIAYAFTEPFLQYGLLGTLLLYRAVWWVGFNFVFTILKRKL
jgi:hypothetical protein